MWQDSSSYKILNSTGLWAPSSATAGWQKELNVNGIGEKRDLNDPTIVAQIAGRVCPYKTSGAGVFIDYSNMTQTKRCLYYDKGNEAQLLDKNNTGQHGYENLQYWTTDKGGSSGTMGLGQYSSYYEGNITTCNVKGMRLPTMYETTMSKPATTYLPTGDGISPTWAGSTNGVPSPGGATWTASANTLLDTRYWTWSGTTSSNDAYGFVWNSSNPRLVRCVLP